MPVSSSTLKTESICTLKWTIDHFEILPVFEVWPRIYRFSKKILVKPMPVSSSTLKTESICRLKWTIDHFEILPVFQLWPLIYRFSKKISLKPMSVLRPGLKTESICMFSANSAARKKLSFFYHVYGSDPTYRHLYSPCLKVLLFQNWSKIFEIFRSDP